MGWLSGGREATGQTRPASARVEAARRPTPDARLDERMTEAAQAGRSAHGAVSLHRAWDQREWVSPWRMVERMRTFAQRSGLAPERVALARMFEARARRRAGQLRESEDQVRSLAFVTRWLMVGALDNEGRGGFAGETPPEAERFGPIDASAQIPGKERPVRWRIVTDVSVLGMVPISAWVRPEQNVCALAHSTVSAPAATDAVLWFGAAGQSKVYVNGALALSDDVPRERAFPDRHGARVRLRPGANRILVKVCVATELPGFYLRLASTAGAPLALAQEPDPAMAPVLAPTPATPPPPPIGVLAELEARVAAPRPAPDDLEDLARWLSSTGSNPAAEDRAADLARRAAQLAPTVSRWLLVADLQRSKNDRIETLARAMALDPTDPLPVLAMAHERRTGMRAESALPLIDRVLDANPSDVTARIERALLLDGAGMSLAARAELERAAAVAPHAAALLEVRVGIASRARLGDETLALRRALLDLRADDPFVHREIALDARARGDRSQVRASLRAAAALAPHDTALLGSIAEVLEFIGDRDPAIATLRGAVDLAPEAPELWRALGEMQVRLGLPEDGRASLRRALALRPQDRALRQHIESLEPAAPRPDEALAEAADVFLRRRTTESNRPAEYKMRSLHELTVRTVYPNGLSGTFRQSVFEVLTAEGAQQYRQIPVGFDQDTQRFELRAARVHHRDGSVDESSGLDEYTVSGGGSRMYYDTREMVVSFARLQPGDVVELRWRVDDVAQRNAFADYFGDLEIFQSDTPRASVRYVLRAPSTRRFYFHPPALPRLSRADRDEGGTRVYDFSAQDVAPVPPEENAPGVTERAAYLHVSTYESWEDVGRWYWGLVSEQLRADDRVRDIARAATRGVREPREQVRAIYNWVIQNTRYVALEFGIHGFKPYRVADVCQRGFGDCKDKASTIVTMLREVGIDASIVLVRTRNNGDVATSPASLAVFDHAIAYVPPLPGLPDGIFLDGTAQSSAMEELPMMDQGAMALVVDQRGGARLTRLPVIDAQRNVVDVRTELEVSPSGAGRLRATHELRGPDASTLRGSMEAEATRVERVERWLSGAHPGLRVSNVRTGDLRNVDQPARIEYEAEIPALGTRQGDVLRFALTAPVELATNYAERSSRTSDVMLPGPLSTRERRTVRLPPGVTVVDLPPAASVRTPWVALEYTLAHTGASITVERSLSYLVNRVPVAQYGAFREACQRIDEAISRRISIRLPSAGGRTP
jgi:transglutaminase-like putative cysteine protease/tetratricopeptide (TPR) repeat protein